MAQSVRSCTPDGPIKRVPRHCSLISTMAFGLQLEDCLENTKSRDTKSSLQLCIWCVISACKAYGKQYNISASVRGVMSTVLAHHDCVIWRMKEGEGGGIMLCHHQSKDLAMPCCWRQRDQEEDTNSSNRKSSYECHVESTEQGWIAELKEPNLKKFTLQRSSDLAVYCDWFFSKDKVHLEGQISANWL